MRSVASRTSLICLVGGALALGGCATTGSVKRAQGSADAAMSAAQRAQGSADTAGSAASGAGTSAQSAAAAAARAQSTADAAATAAQLAGIDARDVDGRLGALTRRVDALSRHRRARHRPVHHHHAPVKTPKPA